MRLYSRISTLKGIFDPSVSICELPGDALLVAGLNSDCVYDVPRAIALPGGRLSAHNTCSIDRVRLVAFDQLTDTLLLVTCVGTDDDYLASLRRGSRKWLEVERICSALPLSPGEVDLVVCESLALLGPFCDNYRLDVYDVSSEHKLRPRGFVAVENEFEHFASARLGADTDTLVAFSHRNPNSVTLHRLVDPPEAALPLRLELLDRIELSEPSHLLFRGDFLLVNETNVVSDKYAIESFRITGGRLIRQSELLDSSAEVVVAAWCIVGDQLIVSDQYSNELVIYSFELPNQNP